MKKKAQGAIADARKDLDPFYKSPLEKVRPPFTSPLIG